MTRTALRLGLGHAPPTTDASAVTPSNTADIAGGVCCSLYVGTGGSLAVITAHGTQLVIANVPAGTILPLCVQRVLATGTTATSIVALR